MTVPGAAGTVPATGAAMSTDTSLELAPDVHLIRRLRDRGGSVHAATNALLIRRPGDVLLVDTGAAPDRDGWWRQVEDLVDLDDVRWIFVSHEDVDHIGNLGDALERCPQAIVVASWQITERLAATEPLPPHRCRWLDDGERAVLGAHEVVALRPPAYDAPTTRGLYDVRSRVYWAADCFGLTVPHPVDDVRELDRDVWADAALRFGRLLSPWVAQVDPGRWRRAVARVAALDLHALASAHGPQVRQRDIDHAIDLIVELPDHPPVVPPAQPPVRRALDPTAAA